MTKVELLSLQEPVTEVDMPPLALSPQPKPKGNTPEMDPSRD